MGQVGQGRVVQAIWKGEKDMERQEVIAKLKGLREEFEKDGLDILYTPIPVALVLSDACDFMEFSQEERAEVLGPEATEAIEEWGPARLWQLTDKGIAIADKLLAEKETATLPVSEVAAVPA